MKTAFIIFGVGFVVSLGSGCTATHTLSLAPANPAAATFDRGVQCLRSVQGNAVSVWLLTPKFRTEQYQFDLPAFWVQVSNGSDQACDFSPANVTVSSGGKSVHVFTHEEYCQAINSHADFLLRRIAERTASQTERIDPPPGSIATYDPLLSRGADGQLMQDFSMYQHGSSTEAPPGIEETAKDNRAAIDTWRNKMLEKAQQMLVQHTVASGTKADGIIKLDPAQISRGQPLKLVITVGGEAHEFVFAVES
jgi:hypothetical protein